MRNYQISKLISSKYQKQRYQHDLINCKNSTNTNRNLFCNNQLNRQHKSEHYQDKVSKTKIMYQTPARQFENKKDQVKNEQYASFFQLKPFQQNYKTTGLSFTKISKTRNLLSKDNQKNLRNTEKYQKSPYSEQNMKSFHLNITKKKKVSLSFRKISSYFERRLYHLPIFVNNIKGMIKQKFKNSVQKSNQLNVYSSNREDKMELEINKNLTEKKIIKQNINCKNKKIGYIQFHKVICPPKINYPKYIKRSSKPFKDTNLNKQINLRQNSRKKISIKKLQNELKQQISPSSSSSDILERKEKKNEKLVDQAKENLPENNFSSKLLNVSLNKIVIDKKMKAKKQVTISEYVEREEGQGNFYLTQHNFKNSDKILLLESKINQQSDCYKSENISLQQNNQASKRIKFRNIRLEFHEDEDIEKKIQLINQKQRDKMKDQPQIITSNRSQMKQNGLIKIQSKPGLIKKKAKSKDSSSMEQLSSLIFTVSNCDEITINQNQRSNFIESKRYYNCSVETGDIDFIKCQNNRTFKKEIFKEPEPKNIYQMFHIRRQRPNSISKKIKKGIISLKCLKSNKIIPNHDNYDKKVKFVFPTNQKESLLIDQYDQEQSLNSGLQGYAGTPRFFKQSIQSDNFQLHQQIQTAKRAKIVGQIYNVPKEYISEMYKYNKSFNLTTMNLIYTEKQLSLQQNSTFLKKNVSSHNAILILLNIDRQILQRIVETRNHHSLKNGIWLYCLGVWRCFIVKFHPQIYKSIIEALQKACLQFYNEDINKISIDVIIKMLSGFNIRKIELGNKKSIIEIIRSLRKGYLINGLTKKHQIYDVQDVEQARNRIQKIIKIKQDQSTFWLKQDQFNSLFVGAVSIQYRKNINWSSIPIPTSERQSRVFYRIYSDSVATGTFTIYCQIKSQQQSPSITLYQQQRKREVSYLKMVGYKSKKKGKNSRNGSVLSKQLSFKSFSNSKESTKKISSNQIYLDFTLKGFYFLLIDCSKVENAVLSYEGSEKIEIQFIQFIKMNLGQGRQFEQNWKQKVEKLQQQSNTIRRTAIKKNSRF